MLRHLCLPFKTSPEKDPTHTASKTMSRSTHVTWHCRSCHIKNNSWAYNKSGLGGDQMPPIQRLIAGSTPLALIKVGRQYVQPAPAPLKLGPAAGGPPRCQPAPDSWGGAACSSDLGEVGGLGATPVPRASSTSSPAPWGPQCSLPPAAHLSVPLAAGQPATPPPVTMCETPHFI